MIVKCSYCGKEFQRKEWIVRRNKSGRFFCIPEHRYLYQKGNLNPNYNHRWTQEKRSSLSDKVSTQFRDGRIVWNKGLDSSDERVKKYSKHLVGNKLGKLNKGKKHPYLSKYNRENNRYGKENPNWRGGHRTRSYRGKDWKEQKTKALERDGYRCSRCNTKSNLTVHHIIKYKLTKDNSLENLTTLCRKCHLIVEPIGPKKRAAQSLQY